MEPQVQVIQMLFDTRGSGIFPEEPKRTITDEKRIEELNGSHG